MNRSLLQLAKRSMAIKRPGSTLGVKPKPKTAEPTQQQYQQQQYPPLEPYQQQQYPPPQQYGQHQYPPQPYGQQQYPPPQGYNPQMNQMGYQQQPPPTMGQTIGRGILDGATFGVGSSIAHRAMDGIMGPRTMNVEHTYAGGAPGGGVAPTPTPAADMSQPMDSQQSWGQPQNAGWGAEPPQQPEWGQQQDQWGSQQDGSWGNDDNGGNDGGDSGGGLFGSLFGGDGESSW